MKTTNTHLPCADPYGVPTGIVPQRTPLQDKAVAAAQYERERAQFVKDALNVIPAGAKQVGGESYVSLSIQPWDALESWMTKEQITGYHLGCIVTYLARYNSKADGKGGKQDLLKAQHYLDKLLEVVG